MHCRARRTRQLGRKHRSVGSSHIELLEERWLLSTFTVTNNADSGPGTLRQAILNANTNTGPDTINFNIKVGAISEVAIPTAASGPHGITSGPDGNIWFTESSANKIGRITPSGTITEFPIPTAGSFPNGITSGPNGNLWFTEFVGNKIGEITP